MVRARCSRVVVVFSGGGEPFFFLEALQAECFLFFWASHESVCFCKREGMGIFVVREGTAVSEMRTHFSVEGIRFIHKTKARLFGGPART